jgi:hypothetical protein
MDVIRKHSCKVKYACVIQLKPYLAMDVKKATTFACLVVKLIKKVIYVHKFAKHTSHP